MNEREKLPERRTYSKPEVRRVELRPEESLAAGCKINTQSAAGPNMCLPAVCFDSGS
jgi:hypothetical protein